MSSDKHVVANDNNTHSIYVAYARQSLARQGDHGDSVSVADQFRDMERYAERLGGRIVARFSDVDTSGSSESRDGLDRMLADVKTIRPAAVLIRDVSRLARDTRVFLTLIDTLKKSNVELLSSTESLEDRTITVVLSAFAERERLALAARIAGGVREHARRGKTHGRPAYGFRRLEGVMTIFEPEAAVVREAFERYTAGDSVTMILNRLNADPTTPKPPETTEWHHATVTKMLRRRSYAGDAVIAARRDISGRLWPAVESRDAHPPIVPRETFDAVQSRFCAPRAIVRQTLVSPFSGFLWCAQCGGRIYAVEQTRPTRPNNLRIARCGNYTKRLREGDRAPGCPGVHGSRALERVERVSFAALNDLLQHQLMSPDEIVAGVAAELAGRDGDKAIAKAKTRLVDLERRRSRLLDAYESGSLDLMTWTGRDRLLAADMESIAALIRAGAGITGR